MVCVRTFSAVCSQKGFTILEVFVAFFLFAFLLVAVIPSANKVLIKSYITSEINYLSSMIQLARSHAIDSELTLVLCPTFDFSGCDNGAWGMHKMLFDDRNFNGKRDADESIIFASQPSSVSTLVVGPKKSIKFYFDGTVASTASFIVCPKPDIPTLNRAVFVSLQGRIRLSQDTDNDGVHERSGHQDLVC